MKLVNLSVTNEPRTTLFEEETDVLIEVITGIRDHISLTTTHGTIILDQLEFGAKAQCILRCNLEGGVLPVDSDHDSDALAAAAIDLSLEVPEVYQTTEEDPQHKRAFPVPGSDNSVLTFPGIMQAKCDGDPRQQLLVMNATYGRFLCSCYMDTSVEAIRALLYAVGLTLAKLCPEDAVLQTSLRSVEQSVHSLPGNLDIRAFVDTTFADSHAPTMTAYRAWRDAGVASGNLTLFFL